MIEFDCEQGSPDWHMLRMGIPTASCFRKLVTAVTLKQSAQIKRYALSLAMERCIGAPLESESSGFMQRGAELESRAAGWYELETSLESRKVGFVMQDDRSCGCSPDRFVADDGLCEIKCYGPLHHGETLLADGPDPEHRLQVQGCLWICDRQWCDLVRFHPVLPSVRHRIERDEKVIRAIHVGVAACNETIDGILDVLRERYGFVAPPLPPLPNERELT